ncbi:MAG: GNAT family N-acetyltransferase [Candidatus Absconditabacteria bacterium]|nr:GNAT family N-acetyltransferase [Candidatus Absconditabacteria bacterium]
MTRANDLEYELFNKAQFLKETNKSSNHIYRFSAYDAPLLMQEVGRLRELAFNKVGGGTGKEFDIDEYDHHFDQLIIWSPKEKIIIGGYRVQKMRILPFEWSPLHHFFKFSEDFITNYAPQAVELGRSFIVPEYQNARKGPFALDNLFDAIGVWISKNPSLKYLVGKITLYPQDSQGNPKDLSVVYEAINQYFDSKELLIKPRSVYKLEKDVSSSGLLCGELKKDLNLLIRKYNAPPLLSVYAGLSPSMRTFGTVNHSEFGNTEETAMMIYLSDIYTDIKRRYNLL